MPWGIAAAAVVSYAAQSNAANKSANAQKSAANASIAEQQREYDLSRQDQLPFLQAGQNAVNLQQQYLNGDTSGFDNSPDYKFALQQGTSQLDRGATARGNLWGGGADADRIALGQGLATQYANNYWNKLAGMAGQGQSSATTLGGLGANMANNIGNAYTNAGQARASSYAAQGNAQAGLINQFGNLAGQYYQSQAGGSNYYNPSYGNNGSGAPSTWNAAYDPNYGSYSLGSAGTGVG